MAKLSSTDGTITIFVKYSETLNVVIHTTLLFDLLGRGKDWQKLLKVDAVICKRVLTFLINPC